MQTDWKVSNFVIRSQENYDSDCQNCSHGFKEFAVWNELESFNVIQNFSCDLMHDMLLGVLRYDMAFIINYLIKSKYFTLDRLNDKIKFLEFSKADAGSAMPQIKQEHMKKKIIIISASEMMSLILYFGILVGDLVPEDDNVWKLYSLTTHILENLLARSFTKLSIMYSQSLIEEHHELTSVLFQEHLRPKYYFLLHYPLIITLLGPPRYFWSMRYESFHELLKNTANSVTCRGNLLLTLSIKQQLRVSGRILSKKGLTLPSNHGLRRSMSKSLLLGISYPFTENAKEVQWICVENIHYRVGFALQLSTPDMVPRFGIIQYIVLDENNYYFVIFDINTVGFSSHLQCYVIARGSQVVLEVHPLNSLEHKYFHNIHYAPSGIMAIYTTK
ncbi:unnamed protein product [Phaedon cochleariae]|uniref:Uncharacterized protein n=1 Tax=Phaedon cochleariae TaxID=80249 RepID=A0A9P0DQ24_PHACE|nr:unnamed protein product [Phaedon cochleariae]